MTVIVDANILISGLINPYSQIAELILLRSPAIDFVIPEYAFEEIASHKLRICKETKISVLQFEQVLNSFMSGILSFSTDVVSSSDIVLAKKIAASIDPKDVWYVAFAIALDALLWTGDLKLHRGLRRKNFQQIITTKELEQIINGL